MADGRQRAVGYNEAGSGPAPVARPRQAFQQADVDLSACDGAEACDRDLSTSKSVCVRKGWRIQIDGCSWTALQV